MHMTPVAEDEEGEEEELVEAPTEKTTLGSLMARAGSMFRSSDAESTSMAPEAGADIGVHDITGRNYQDRSSLGAYNTFGVNPDTLSAEAFRAVWYDNVTKPAKSSMLALNTHGVNPLVEETNLADQLRVRAADKIPNAAQTSVNLGRVSSALFDNAFGLQRKMPEAAKNKLQTLGGPDAEIDEAYLGTAADFRGALFDYTTLLGGDAKFVIYAVNRGLTTDKGPHHSVLRTAATLKYNLGARNGEGASSAPTSRAAHPSLEFGYANKVAPQVLARMKARFDGSGGVFLVQRLKTMVRATDVTEGSFEIAVKLQKAAVNDQIKGCVRPVAWAPVETRAAGSAQIKCVYTPTSIALCATSAYEHLIDSVEEQASLTDAAGDGDSPLIHLRVRDTASDQLVAVLRREMKKGLKAALKLKQLPYMLNVIEAHNERSSSVNGVQEAIASSTDRAVVLSRSGGIRGPATYATFVPTQRVIGDNTGDPARGGPDTPASVLETMLPASAGIFLDTPTARGAFAAVDTEREASQGTSLNVPHLPLSIPHSNDLPTPGVKDYAYDGADMTLTLERRSFGARHPHWLAEDVNGMTGVESFVKDCHNLVSKMREMRTQRDAILGDLSDSRVETSAQPGFVERERRGAIWEDALRELSVSQDRLYNFLRTMAGTLHEDINAVVEVEDHTMEASNRAIRERRNDILKQSAQFQGQLIQTVMSGVLRGSNLSFDLTSPSSGADFAKKLVVVNKETVKKVQELASGASGMPFFQQNVELEQRLGADTGTPMQLTDLLSTLQSMAKEMRDALLAQLDENMIDGQRSTLEYLAKPRNSYLIRMKNEAYSAIKTAYSAFCTEWRAKYHFHRQPNAWELIEGVDMHLSTAFAEFAAHKLAHARMHSSSHAAYVGVAPARANAVQLRMTLNKLVNRACEYVQTVERPNFSASTSEYRGEAPTALMIPVVESNYHTVGLVMGSGAVRNPRYGQMPGPPRGGWLL